MNRYPFRIPDALQFQLPHSSRDGFRYIDVRFHGKWDGVLVIDGGGSCIGVYMERRVLKLSLQFAPGEIEEVRKASLHNRILVGFPFDLWTAAMVMILAISPAVLALGF